MSAPRLAAPCASPPSPEEARPVADASIQWVLIGAMAVWGLNVAAVKALTTSFDPTLLAAVRMLVATASLVAVVLWRRCGVPALSLRQFGAVLGCAVLMVYLNQLLFAEGLLRSKATNGALVMALSPLVSSLMAALVFREALTLQRMLGVALGFAGVAAVVLSHPGAGLSRAGVGDLMLVAAVVSFALGGVIVQRLARDLHPLSISLAVYAAGAVLLVVHSLVGPTTLTVATIFPGPWPWALVLFSGVLGTGIGNLIWNQAISRIGVARTAVFLYWVPIFGVGFAALFLGERLTWWHLAGFVAVMTGTWLGTRRPVPTPLP